VLLGVSGFPAGASARGIHDEPAPWYSPAFHDTLLSLEVGATYAFADTHDTALFPLVLSSIRRGPLQFAGSWSYISMRGRTEHRSDFGDLKIYGRYRLPVFRDSTETAPPGLWIEASARVGISKPKLYPFATGGQEIELGGAFTWPRLLQAILGAGRIWSEPASDAPYGSLTVPHATHVWLQGRVSRRALDVQVRGDVFVYEVKDIVRSRWTASLVRRSVRGFHLTAEYAVETGNDSEHVFDHLFGLRLATRLR
jgi:hypothetical protein